MATEKAKVEVLEIENLNVIVNGINKDTNSQFNRENVYFVTFGAKLGTDFKHHAITEGVKIDSRSIHFNTIQQIAENNAKLDISKMAVINLTINKVKTEKGSSGWIVSNVMQTQTKFDFIKAAMADGISKEEALEIYELSL